MPALDAVLQEKIAKLASQSLKRELKSMSRAEFPYVERGGRKLISFSCNDYLGLSTHPEVVAAGVEAAQTHGAGGGASRLISGNNPLYDKLEEELIKAKQTEAACVFGSGYLANLATIPALVGKGDLILADKLVHACMIDAAKLSGATFKRFAHNDMAQLSKLLQTHREKYQHCLILTETVFSMDGDLAPLSALSELADEHDAWLMSDDAHGLGVLKRHNPAHIQMGTLSKAAGAYGGYVCGSSTLIDYLKTAARPLIFSTALPPSVLASTAKALEIMRTDESLQHKLMANVNRFTEELGMPKSESAIVPLIMGEAEAVLEASAQLEVGGFLVVAIRPPTVPKGTARLRFAFSALHEDDQIESLINKVKAYGWLKHIDAQRLDTAS